VCCHSFRATGITAYLKNGGRLEIAQQMANHESSRTTGLYDRRGDEVSLDEVEPPVRRPTYKSVSQACIIHCLALQHMIICIDILSLAEV
jgi:hypothetical protein